MERPELSVGEAICFLLLAFPLALFCLLRSELYLLPAFIPQSGSIPMYQAYRGLACVLEWSFVVSVVLAAPSSLRRSVERRHSILLWIVLAWLATASVSVVLSSHQGAALFRHVEWISHAAFAWAVWTYLRDRSFLAQGVLLLMLTGFFLVLLRLAVYWIQFEDPRAHDWIETPPLFLHGRHIGYYVLGGFALSQYLFFRQKASWTSFLTACAASTVCWLFLSWLGGRGAILSALVVVAFGTWMLDTRRRASYLGGSIAAALTGGSLSLLFEVERGGMGLMRFFRRTTNFSSVRDLSPGRVEMWQASLEALDSHLWFGLGPDGFLYITPSFPRLHPHSVVIQALVEWGLIGATLFAALLLFVFWKGFNNLHREVSPRLYPVRLAALALLVGSSVHALVDGLFYYSLPLMLMAASAAIVLLPHSVASASSKSPQTTDSALALPASSSVDHPSSS